MTDQDNLRDRIAAAITKCPSVNPYVMARAIIDDLGLTVEERIDEPGKRGINPVRRIVGEWEKQCPH